MKNLGMLFVALLLVACTDYEGVADDKFEELLAAGKIACDKDMEGEVVYTRDEGEVVCRDGLWRSTVSSSSTQIEDPGSSTSVISDSDRGSSSSKANWAYLNPAISYGEFTDTRDGQVYKTVKIGIQVWMAENLNYFGGDVKSYCYKSVTGNCSKYGRLYSYQWSQNSNICPTGWHLPNNDEWNILFDYVGGIASAGTELKSSRGWRNSGTDSFGFAVLPAGKRDGNGNFDKEGDYAYFWSSSNEVKGYLNDYWFFNRDVDSEYRNNGWGFGFSVRCLRDSCDEETEELYECANGDVVVDKANCVDLPSSSSVKDPEPVEGSSSSIASSSSVKSSSSFISVPLSSSGTKQSSCSSEKSSSSIESSSSVVSSSSIGKLNWQYLNPDIDYGEFTDPRDGQVYKTVKIGTQTWMAENLNYSINPGEQSWCAGNIESANCELYGRVYTWLAAVGKTEEECASGYSCNLSGGNVQGVCPNGWHLPSNDEWDALYNTIGGIDIAGKKLRANTELWNENANTDEYGFAMLPATSLNGSFESYGLPGYDANFWSYNKNVEGPSNAWHQYFNYYSDNAGLSDEEGYLFTVRCLKDSSN